MKAAALVTDWSLYPNFSKQEFDCRHTGENKMQAGTMARLQRLRDLFGKPMVVSSGYRHETHPVEAGKPKPGLHNEGCSVDILVHTKDAYQLMALAIQVGFTGIGFSQKGAHGTRFIHLDDHPGNEQVPRPTIWSY